MRHLRKTIIVAAVALLFGGCSTKACRCYLLEKWGNVVIEEVYTDGERDCGELGYSVMNPNDSSYRHCTETDVELMDTMDIVHMFWD